MESDHLHMTRALTLAKRGQGVVEPNPMVGCVIVRQNKVVGEGCHRQFGQAHAEVEALKVAGKKARGATVYVTLEPCAHFGKTPPCADALIQAEVARVVVAMKDPFEKVAGRGIAKLCRAGIKVEVGLCSDEAKQLNAPFIKRITQSLPWVIAKWAATVDGKIATRTGDSQWISNEKSRKWVHQLRSRLDAVIVGVGTALNDNPMLTARDVKIKRIARRVVIDPNLKLPNNCKLIQSIDQAPLTIAVANKTIREQSKRVQQLRNKGVEIVGIKQYSKGKNKQRQPLDMTALLKYLCKTHDATNVMVEGGAVTHGSFFEQGTVDELLMFIGPKLLGDGDAISPVDFAKAVPKMNQSKPLQLDTVKRIGDDVLLRYLT